MIIAVVAIVGYSISNKATVEPNPMPATDLSEKSTVQPIGTLKGRPFQELVDLSNRLTGILYDRTLSRGRRAELLSQMLQADYHEMYQGVLQADEAYERCCDGPCFAAIQDTIIGSYTDETLDAFWYYEIKGQDSVLMFDMQAYNACMSDETASNETLAQLEAEIALDNLNAERFFSPDGRCAVYITVALDPYVREQILAGKDVRDGRFINGLNGVDLTGDGTERVLIIPGSGAAKDYIGTLLWSLDSESVFFSSGDAFMPSWGVYRYDFASGEISIVSGGYLIEMITDEPYAGYLKVCKSCFVDGETGRHWYYAAISPDGEKEAQLTEPSLEL